jgi:hypothetical protein
MKLWKAYKINWIDYKVIDDTCVIFSSDSWYRPAFLNRGYAKGR